ncbi:MAG: VTC domain-containing protein [Butyricicoccus sp.]
MSEYQGTFKRYEKKYLVTQQQYNALAKVFAARMVPDRFAESTISNIYYDTPDFRLIRRSLDRPAYKGGCACVPTARRVPIPRRLWKSENTTTSSTSAALR